MTSVAYQYELAGIKPVVKDLTSEDMLFPVSSSSTTMELM